MSTEFRKKVENNLSSYYNVFTGKKGFHMIGERVKERRLELGLTQEELARKMGFKSKASINKIESNKTDVNQTKTAQFANVLQTSIAYLMGWTNNTDAEDDDVALSIKKAVDLSRDRKQRFGEFMSDKEIMLVESYRSASEKDRRTVDVALELDRKMEEAKTKLG